MNINWEKLASIVLLTTALVLVAPKAVLAVACYTDGSMPDAGKCCVRVSSGATENSCYSGDVPDITSTPGDCTCVPATGALTEFFTIINGIVLPVVVIGGMFIIVRAGYKILTSQGNPQELQEGKENLTSAIIGLVFVLMAVSILRVIIKALITGDADIGF